MENPFGKMYEREQDPLETNNYLVKAIKEARNIKVPEEYRDNEGKLLSAPNGTKSKLENELHWKIVRTDSFKKRFGDWENGTKDSGKIVDENGEPLLNYHASNRELEELTPDSSNHFLTLGKGVYLTPDASLSSIYGDKFYSCFINTKKVVPELKNLPQGIQITRTLFYSITRPKNTALSSKFDENETTKKELNGEDVQFSVLHKENIMIIPSDIENPDKKACGKQISYMKNNWNDLDKN